MTESEKQRSLSSNNDLQHDSISYWLLPEYKYISDFSNGYGYLVKDDMVILVDADNQLIPSHLYTKL